jgi:hypothetical protein
MTLSQRALNRLPQDVLVEQPHSKLIIVDELACTPFKTINIQLTMCGQQGGSVSGTESFRLNLSYSLFIIALSLRNFSSVSRDQKVIKFDGSERVCVALD